VVTTFTAECGVGGESSVSAARLVLVLLTLAVRAILIREW
jgi:hypothetical protein